MKRATTLAMLAMASLIVLPVSADNDLSHYWASGFPWRVWWNSPVGDNQSTYTQFPSDVRQDMRNAAMHWDDYIITASQLNFDETWGGTYDLEIIIADFSDEGWWNQAGIAFHYIPSGWEVEDGWVYLNSDWDWTNEEMDWANEEADAMTVLLHEIGHPTGMDHPSGSLASDCPEVTVMCSGDDYEHSTTTTHDRDHMEDKY